MELDLFTLIGPQFCQFFDSHYQTELPSISAEDWNGESIVSHGRALYCLTMCILQLSKKISSFTCSLFASVLSRRLIGCLIVQHIHVAPIVLHLGWKLHSLFISYQRSARIRDESISVGRILQTDIVVWFYQYWFWLIGLMIFGSRWFSCFSTFHVSLAIHPKIVGPEHVTLLQSYQRDFRDRTRSLFVSAGAVVSYAYLWNSTFHGSNI